MRKALPFLFTLLTLAATAQDRATVNFRSYAQAVCLTPSNGFFVATRVGEVAVPGDSAGTWRLAKPVTGKGYLAEPLMDNMNFFNNDTGFVSGFIQDSAGLYNVYYHTVDGGKHWNKRRFADAGWADDVVHLANGEAWASISGTAHIDYSHDYGLTWQQLNTPRPKERYAKIFFNTLHEGLIGSLWNALDYTADNGKTWRNIPTPLDQHAYTKSNIGARPEINKLAIFGNYLIIAQENQVFATLRDSIHWQLLPYDGFIADNNTATLYFVRQKTVSKANSDLSLGKRYMLENNAAEGRYSNGRLAFWNNRELTTMAADGSMRKTLLYTNERAVANPVVIGYDMKYGSVGYMGNKLYTQKEFDGDWVYKATVPFAVNGRRMEIVGHDSLLVMGPGDSLLYYSFETNWTSQITVPELLSLFCKSPVQKIIFESGSQGCFHQYADNVIYQRDGDVFSLEDNHSTGSKHTEHLHDYPDDFRATLVDSFIAHLQAGLQELPAIPTLGLTPKDYDQCKKDIRDFQAYVKKGKADYGIEEKGFRLYKNNINFDRLLSLTDSVAAMPPTLVDSLLYNTSTMWSTTTNWIAIKFVLDGGATLVIENSYFDPNSLHFPWTVRLKGYAVNKNLVMVNRFIGDTYPAFLPGKGHADIVEHFVKSLYGE